MLYFLRWSFGFALLPGGFVGCKKDLRKTSQRPVTPEQVTVFLHSFTPQGRGMAEETQRATRAGLFLYSRKIRVKRVETMINAGPL
jgi:hypothetical protein